MPRMTATNAVRPVHRLPGRTRLHVAGLRRSPRLRSLVSRGLAELHGVNAVSASAETGNVLVLHDAALATSAIESRIQAALDGTLALEQAAQPAQWYLSDPEAAAAELGTSIEQGLDTETARERLRTTGPNLLPRPVGRSGLQILANQLSGAPVLLLAAAGLVSLLTGGIAEAAAIAAVLVLNGGIGFAVESRAERTISSLGAQQGATARVVRDGAATDVPIANLVPGDVILLARDTMVPADARVVQADRLTLNEAALTGESLPVEKTAAPLTDARPPLSERDNMVWRGTAVTGGTGAAVVIATGRATELGRVHALLDAARAPATPMQRQLDRIGHQLLWAGLAACGLVVGVGLLRGLQMLHLLRSAVSLGVAAIPEALPTIATTTLALGVEKLRQRNVLVRRLDAVETLGAVQVVCFDKTGTLTANRMSVAAIVCGEREFHGGKPSDPADPRLLRLLEIGALCSETELSDGVLEGSATENALVRQALDAGIDVAALRAAFPRLWVRYRSDSCRFMATAHHSAAGTLLAVKGSPPDVLDRCTAELSLADHVPLLPQRREAIAQANAALAARGLRVLGFASREHANGPADPVSDLTWIGLAGLADPVRPEAGALMKALRKTGIHPLVMTGDQVATARAVAHTLGLNGTDAPRVHDATDMVELAPPSLAALAREAHVFARVSPAQKLEIVRALQADGAVVAMVGDGFNDSPALKAADVGIATGGQHETGPGSGTPPLSAARDAADMVLLDNALGAVATAIELGRATQGNVRRASRYLLGTNLSEIAVVLAATAAGIAEPLTPLQLLWINLVSDVLPGLGLACEPPAAGLMHRPPLARDEPILRGADWRMLAREGGTIAGGAMASGVMGLLRHGAGPEARGMAFGSLVMAQLLHALTCRNPEPRGVGTNKALAGALAAAFGAQGVALMVPGLRSRLGIVPLAPLDIGITLIGGLLPYVFNESLVSAPAPAPPACSVASST